GCRSVIRSSRLTLSSLMPALLFTGLVVARLEAVNQRDEVAMVCDLRLLCRKTRLKSPVGPGREK
ncbi:MAG: hypothetical protein VXV97_16250, partial [Pseudomonadota bacterium]|nr:hypothetical protein [Pseudomonadota bacterium]